MTKLSYTLRATTHPLGAQFQTGLFLTTLARPAAWKERTVCLPPFQSGRPIDLSWMVDVSTAAGCGTVHGTREYLYLDDIVVTTDPSCPTQ